MPLTQVIGFTEPFKATQQFYVGLTFSRTATGSGLGTESAVGRGIPTRTATGSGVGGFDSTGLVTHVRQGADSAGTGSSSSARIILRSRTATGSGMGTESAYGAKSALRTATGSGVGSATALGLRTVFASATASGTSDGTALGIRVFTVSATGTGVGSTSESVLWSKSRIFRVPQTTTYTFAKDYDYTPKERLMAHITLPIRAENLYRLSDGTYTINDPRNNAAVRTYLGAHNIFLDDTEVAELTAAGYGAYIT
jgi:hypothetical protein